MTKYPKRTGFKLTYDAECLYDNWLEIGGCCCFLGCAPCRSCTDEGNPLSLEENDEAWEIDEDWARANLTFQMIADDTSPYGRNRGYKDMSRSEIKDKSSTGDKDLPQYKFGDRVVITGKSNGHSYQIGDVVYLREKNGATGTFKSSKTLDGMHTVAGNILPKDFVLYETLPVKLDTEVEESKLDINLLYKEAINKVGASLTTCGFTGTPKFIVSFNQQEDVNMSTNNQRKTVTVNLIDRDSALDEKFALVATFGEFTTSKSSEALIRSIIIDPKNDVAKLIAQHNEVRVKQTNNEILNRTGNKVTLEAVEESDLYWEIR